MASEPVARRMIGALLRIPFQAIVSEIHQDLEGAGYADLRPAHFSVFQHIHPEGSRPTDLAEQAQITKQSMGYLVGYLEDRGYVERVPDPVDGRARVVRLTTRGWEVDRQARATVRRLEAEWARWLGKKRLVSLQRALEDLAAKIEELEREHGQKP